MLDIDNRWSNYDKIIKNHIINLINDLLCINNNDNKHKIQTLNHNFI